MSTALLDRVLSCPALPTLPGVAVRVLELTRDPNVSITALAQAVQADPALAVKVLKTVNSSYYGLSAPCPSIPRALNLLGLNTVKAIVLSFSLVDCTRAAGLDERFDMAAFWRRAVHCAAAARALAAKTRCCDPEEAFIGALVLDIGVLACFAAIKDEYLAVLKKAPTTDHDRLCEVERAKLGFDHGQAGKLLAERWKLPQRVRECVGADHPAEGASDQPMERVMYLAGRAAGALASFDEKKREEFVRKAAEWFGIDGPGAEELLGATRRGAAELLQTMDLKGAAAPSRSSLLTQARAQLAVAQEAVQREAAELRISNTELSRKTITDGLTGAFNRRHFDIQLKECFDAAKRDRKPLAVIFIDGDRFKNVNDTHGHQAGDAVLIELSRRLRAALGKGGQVFRYGGEEFAVLMPNVSLAAATSFAESLRGAVAASPFDLRPHGVALTLPVTISLGVAAMEPSFAATITEAQQITLGADRGVYAAKAGGRNCVKAIDLSGPAPIAGASNGAAGASGPQPRTVLIVEDDPLAAKLMSFLFSKCKDLRPMVVKSGEEALEWAETPSAARPRPDLIVSDLNLPGMSGITLIKRLREKAPSMPFLIVTAAADANNRAAALGAGADAFVDKAEFCTNTDHWLSKVAELMDRARAAA